jgi:hypothetical protein
VKSPRKESLLKPKPKPKGYKNPATAPTPRKAGLILVNPVNQSKEKPNPLPAEPVARKAKRVRKSSFFKFQTIHGVFYILGTASLS